MNRLGCHQQTKVAYQRRYSSRLWFIRIFIIPFLFLTASHLTFAQDDQPKPPDVRLIIDVSGSMKKNDPNNLRQPAVDLLVKLLPDGSKAGVWTFGRYVNMLVPHREVNDTWRKTASSKAEDINSTGLFTNIGEALEKAAYDLDRPNDEYNTHLILLTDGMVDISRDTDENQQEWRRIVDQLLPKFKDAGFTIHTISLSENADSELMNRLAAGTDGVTSVAGTADALMEAFLQAFNSAAPAEQLPLEGNSFVVDSSIEEFTALVFPSPGSPETALVGPDQETYRYSKESEYVNWHHTEKYDLITVSKPVEGEWQILADLEPNSRVTVVSNLNLIVKPLKNNIYIDDLVTLNLLLSEDGKTITRRDFLELLDVDYMLSKRGGDDQWSESLSDPGVPSNGIYSKTLSVFSTEAYYDLKVVVDGKSFKREFSHSLAVRKPFATEVDKKIIDGKTHFIITVSSFGDDINYSDTRVAARVKDPEGRNSIQPLTLTEFDSWVLDLPASSEGTFDIGIRINAVDSAGGEYEYSPNPIRLRYPDGDDPFGGSAPEQEPPLTEPEVEPEPLDEMPKDDVEPAVEAEPEPITPEPEASQLAATQPEEDQEESSKLWLYIGLGVGNLIILVAAFFAYRMIMGKKPEAEDEDVDELVANTAKDLDKTPPPEAAPSMADMSGEEEAPQEEPGLSADLDLSADVVEEESDDEPAEVPEPPPLDAGDIEEEDSGEELGVTDVEFSLDDFSSDDLDEEEDDK
ncbi:VWA domain-containing protein [Aurantivibrio plasticivorans]